MGPGRSILQTGAALLLIAAGPLSGGAGVDFELGGHRVQSHMLLKNSLSELLSTNQAKSCLFKHSKF
jgi:hypothetical protein